MLLPTRHWDKTVLLDSETADWCARNEDGTLDLSRRTPERGWTRLIQFQVFVDGVGQGVKIIDLHPDTTTDKDCELVEELQDLLDGGACAIIQRSQYDIPRLAKLGINVTRFRDTLILSQLVYAGMGTHRHSLNEIMKRELGSDPYEEIGVLALDKRIAEGADDYMVFVGDSYTREEALAMWRAQELAKTKKRLQASDWSVAELSKEQWDYAAMDVSEPFYKVWERLEKRIEKLGMEKIAELEHQTLPAVMDMESNGIKMHMDKWDAYLADTKQKLDTVETRIRDVVDPWTQELYPEKFLITLKRLKPKEGKPARLRKDGTVIREEIPAQTIGDLAARQPTPELFPLLSPTQDLLDFQEGDRRVGSVVWAELGLTTSPDNYAAHQFNIASARQMRALVNDMLGYARNREGEYDNDQLKFAEQDVKDLVKECERRLDISSGAESMAIAQVRALLKDHLEAQGLRKILSTYGASYQAFADENGYIHSSFQTCATFTGRMSSSEPNIQNPPRELQHLLFCCEEGEAMVSVDYSNMEGRTLFYVTGQMDIYQKLTAGMDLHSLSASFMLNKPYDDLVERLPGESKDSVKKQFKDVRQAAKAVTFAPMFGCGPKKISELLNCSYEDAVRFLNRYWKTYPITKQTLDKQFESAVNHGFVTDLSFGRRRFFEMNDEDRAELAGGKPRMDVLGKWKAEAYNYCAQSGGASCLKVALVHLKTWIERHPETKTKLRLCVHDSIKVTCDLQYADFVGAEIKRIMETAAEYVLGGARVPADVEIYRDKQAPRTFRRCLEAAA